MMPRSPATEPLAVDVIVIGGGLSGGLPAAAYLQKAGLQVLVVEANAEPGSFCCTHETWPQTLDSRTWGVSFAGNSPVIADLELERYGFRFAASPVVFATTYRNGTNCLICQDPARTAENFARHSARDGQRKLEIQSRVHETMVEFNELSSFSPHPDPGKLPRVFDLCAYAMDFPVEQMMEMTGPELCERTFESDACRQILSCGRDCRVAGGSWFRISFGRLQLKAYTKGEHVLRFEATVHNARELRCRRSLDNFDQIIGRLAGMADRFAVALDCADIGFLPDGVLDELPLPAQAGTRRIAGIDLNKPRIRAALAAALALAPAPGGFTVAEHAARVRQITGHDGYTIRQAAYDLRKLRGKQLVDKPGRTRRYHVPPPAARTISALLTLRDHVIAPILSGIRSPQRGRKPKIWTAADRDYETLRIGMQALFRHIGIETQQAAA